MLPMLLIVSVLGIMALLAGSVMILVGAFRQHVLWGLAYLFLPLASLIFLIIHWAEAKKGFFVSLAGLIVFAAPLLCNSTVRDEVMKQTSQRLAARPGGLPIEPERAPEADFT